MLRVADAIAVALKVGGGVVARATSRRASPAKAGLRQIVDVLHDLGAWCALVAGIEANERPDSLIGVLAIAGERCGDADHSGSGVGCHATGSGRARVCGRTTGDRQEEEAEGNLDRGS